MFDRVAASDALVRKGIKASYHVLRYGDLDDWTVGGVSEGLITYIFSQFASDNEQQRLANSETVARKLAEYLSTNFQDQSCWLGEAEEKFGVSKFHLIRAFKAKYKKTPHRFLTELRINYAASRLRQRNEKIIDIASNSGFDDLSAFNKCFKRRFGCTPRDFASR